MAEQGIDCKGPFPCDTIYIKAFAGDYDSVLSMYHDQGQIATKLKGFNKGVTITAGLEIVSTTPSHGTAFRQRPLQRLGLILWRAHPNVMFFLGGQ